MELLNYVIWEEQHELSVSVPGCPETLLVFAGESFGYLHYFEDTLFVLVENLGCKAHTQSKVLNREILGGNWSSVFSPVLDHPTHSTHLEVGCFLIELPVVQGNQSLSGIRNLLHLE